MAQVRTLKLKLKLKKQIEEKELQYFNKCPDQHCQKDFL